MIRYIQYGNEDKEKSREIEQTLDICVYFFSKIKNLKEKENVVWDWDLSE